MVNLDAIVTALGDMGAGSYSVALARHQSSGLYDFNNRYQNNVLSTRLNFVPRADTDVRLSLRYNDYAYQYPTNGGGAVVDTNTAGPGSLTLCLGWTPTLTNLPTAPAPKA